MATYKSYPPPETKEQTAVPAPTTAPATPHRTEEPVKDLRETGVTAPVKERVTPSKEPPKKKSLGQKASDLLHEVEKDLNLE